ncbi:MAG TPA: hypothetical protein EYN66_03780 [Myxococcales bacterium]|nr:hypothetical protein [Myxococcales bacterium]
MVTVPRNKLAFPQTMKTTLRYVERIDFVPTTTGVHQYQFRANDLRDPNKTGTGHQPRGFDEFMDIYNTFTVTASRISVTWMYEGYNGPSEVNPAGNLIQRTDTATAGNTPALTPMVCGVHKGLEILTAGAAEIQMEKDKTAWCFINSQSGSKTQRMSLKVSDFYGKGTLVGAEGYTGTKALSPTEVVFFELWCGRVSNDYASETTKVVAYATIEYDAVFTEPKTLGDS